MRKFVGPAALLLACAVGCGDSNESLRKQQVQVVREAVEALTAVRDAASAEAARPKLKKLGERWRDLARRSEALPSSAERSSKQTDDELGSLMKTYLGEVIRVAFVPGGKAALDEIGEVKPPR